MKQHGVILAGGEGSRMGNVTKHQNKHTLLVYDRPMIEYPARTLQDMGVDHAHIITSPLGLPDLFRRYRDEINGLSVRFETQYQPLGAADALGHTAIEGTFPVLCGDVYFDPAPKMPDKPTIYWTDYYNANQHSVYDPMENRIVEKPTVDLGRRAVVAYIYDDRVYDVIKTLKPTERGELELIDLHNWYLQHGADVREYKGFFQDMGTADGLLRVANHIAWKKKHNK